MHTKVHLKEHVSKLNSNKPVIFENTGKSPKNW